MQKRGKDVLYAPSDLIRYLESPFATWMDRLVLERPGAAEPGEEGEDLEILARYGREHEAHFLERLRTEHGEVVEIERGEGDEAATREALRAGAPVVYQAALALPPFRGYADFLVRAEGKGPKGGALHEVWDTKLGRSPRPHYLIQLCAYAEMLEVLQGVRPRHVHVALGTNEVRAFRTDDHFWYYRHLKAAFVGEMAAFDPKRPPEPEPGRRHGRWQAQADAWFERTDHLCRVAGITRGQIRRLREAGVTTRAALATKPPKRVPGLRAEVWERLVEQARLQVRSEGKDRPLYRVIPPPREDPRRGLGLLPPPSAGDVYFDMEGFPLLGEGLEYLFGAVEVVRGKPVFHDWWAHDAASEKRAFEAFVDWAHARWRSDPGMHVYHYAPYEVSALSRLMGRHGTREDEVDDLLRHRVFVDVYAVVRQGLRVGTPGYSIKDVERLYREAREGEVQDAGASMAWFERWLRSGEPMDPARSETLRAIRAYNEADCESLRGLVGWLRERQEEAGVSYAAPPGVEEGPEEEEAPESERAKAARERRALAEALLAKVPEDPAVRAGDADRWRLQELLGHLLQYHRREEKPFWWAHYARLASEPEALVQDLDCLGDLRLLGGAPVPLQRSSGFRYGFDPDQDTKLAAGDGVFLVAEQWVAATIEELDREAGTALVKLGPKALRSLGGTAPARTSLLPGGPVATTVLEEGIARVAAGWRRGRKLSPALEDLLRRARPKVGGPRGGGLLRAGEGVVEGARRLVAAMRGTTLCVQGPPGAGKTRTAAEVIVRLLAAGKRVGILSNSHKAIHHLIEECQRRGEGHVDLPLRALKQGGADDGDFFRRCPGVTRVANLAEGMEGKQGGLLCGGTAWAFAREEMEGLLDHLFVDEAGQVSLANLVAVSGAAENLVLLGDQMQLAQPTQGTHPGESGSGSLQYVLQDHPTIPEDLGLFLPTTWRLHPRICRFISGAVYEDRLEAEPRTARRVVRVPAEGARWVREEAGIRFVAVEHEGNTQASEEEVARVRAIWRELQGRAVTDATGRVQRELRLGDVLFVAPYNAQVRRLRDALPRGARIGSVDKFQGQEAPVVVVSLCTSFGEAGPRGLDFVLDRNRLNVAISRAQSLAIVVGDPRLARSPCATVDQMARLNLLCRLMEEGGPGSGAPSRGRT